MPKENVYFELFNMLRGKFSVDVAAQEIEVLSYFAYKTVSFDVNFSEVDFSEHKKFNEQVLAIAEKCDVKTSSLIKDIVVSGVIQCCDELNDVFKVLLQLKKEDILELLNNGMEYYNGVNMWSTNEVLCNLFVELTKNMKTKNVLDICSGKGNLLGSYVKANEGVKAKGIELNYPAALISKLKLNLLDADYHVDVENVLNKPMKDEYDLVYCHYPWGMRSKDNIVEDINPKLNYSNMNRSRIDWAFIIKSLNAINEQGKAFVVAPLGVLFSSTDTINRKELVDNGYLETIITLPAGSITGTGVAYCMMILSKENKKVKLVDASELYDKVGNRKVLKIKGIVDLVNTPCEKCIEVTSDEIASKNYNLSFSVFVEDDLSEKLINPKPLNELSEVITGFQYTSKSLKELPVDEGNVRIVKINNIEDGHINQDSIVSANIDLKKVSKYILKDNDILLSNKGNNPKLVFVEGIEDKCIIPQSNLTIIRVNSSKINPLYLYAFLMSDIGKNCLQSLMKGTVVIANISRKDLMEMQVPVLDMEDQELIATRFNILQNKLNEVNDEARRIRLKLASIYSDKVGE